MSVPLCYYGSPTPPPARRRLRAGQLTAVYEAGDLRYVRHGRAEVCRRWYAAVRDRNWGTVPGVISEERIEETADGFRVRYTSAHRQGDIHFVWHADIVGTAEGITFTFDGEAKSTFLRNRIGFCVLHPPETCAGQPVWLNGREGSRFPDLIAPRNPFTDVSRLSHPLPDGGRVDWSFEGDLFETEDQRNWIDASFKTFCTPLSRPFPVTVNAGERVRQVVTLQTTSPGELPERWEAGPDRLQVGPDRAANRLPEIGLSRPTHRRPADGRELELLRLLRPRHLRVEIDLTGDGWVQQLADAWQEAQVLGAALELAATVSDDVWTETCELISALHRLQPRLARVLALHNREWATPDRVITPVVEAVARYDASVPVFVGTAASFAELNRGRPSVAAADGACYAVSPQEHAFDNASLVETCAAIADTVRSARQFGGDKSIGVTPITLRKRVNPYATGPAAPTPPGELPPTVDARQMSLFGAAWTLGALKYLAEWAVASATFYETTGSLGVMENTNGCPPERFPSKPGMVFPLFHVLADTNEVAGAAVVRCESADPLRFNAMVLQSESGKRVMLANMTAGPQTVAIDDWRSGPARVRTLDETTFDLATSDPVEFRRRPGELLPTTGDRLTLPLKPYAYVRIDE